MPRQPGPDDVVERVRDAVGSEDPGSSIWILDPVVRPPTRLYDSRVSILQPRRKTRSVRVGDLVLGSEHPIRVQTMTKGDTADVHATFDEIIGLEATGCELVRVSVPSESGNHTVARSVVSPCTTCALVIA